MTLHKTSKGDAFSLRISAFSAFNGNFNAEGRRERSTFLSKTNPDEAMTRPKYIS